MRMKRRIEAELLDAAPAAEAEENLRDLVRINRWLGGHWVLPGLVESVAGRGEALRVLDVGAASGDMGEALRRRFPRARVVALDRLARNLGAAEGPKVVADAFRLPFGPRTFDVVMANLFLHHFEEEAAVRLLEEMARVAGRAVVVLDLWRHRVAKGFLPATRGLCRWHELTVADGVRSVEAGFVAAELGALARRAGLGAARVRRHLPWFRVSMVARVGGGNLLT